MPSPAGSALVVSAPTSLPACGSVRFIVPLHSPEMSFGRYNALISSEAWCSSASIWPCVISGLRLSDRQAEAIISFRQVAS